eukprot:TRINITY_DN8749_c0_g1::TRINITY_DN8749_c0_g1_i1::g.23955::m.23955 TRINITY_DN8749_c0_g1::TRINITY_DN8749_c0_g1_i1::g.23955  ORF type:complete len:364 (-),score=7.69,DDE_3/PF13358.1/0.048 TRINITY_DN8749_c0_g1_i1:394-1485(-)
MQALAIEGYVTGRTREYRAVLKENVNTPASANQPPKTASQLSFLPIQSTTQCHTDASSQQTIHSSHVEAPQHHNELELTSDVHENLQHHNEPSDINSCKIASDSSVEIWSRPPILPDLSPYGRIWTLLSHWITDETLAYLTPQESSHNSSSEYSSQSETDIGHFASGNDPILVSANITSDVQPQMPKNVQIREDMNTVHQFGAEEDNGSPVSVAIPPPTVTPSQHSILARHLTKAWNRLKANVSCSPPPVDELLFVARTFNLNEPVPSFTTGEWDGFTLALLLALSGREPRIHDALFTQAQSEALQGHQADIKVLDIVAARSALENTDKALTLLSVFQKRPTINYQPIPKLNASVCLHYKDLH